MIVKCSNCEISFEKEPSQIKKTNNNFCSRSCAGTFNGKKFPKRKAIERFCKKCNISLGFKKRLTVCLDCNATYIDWDNMTIQDVIDRTQYKRHCNIYNRIRQNARKTYKQSSKPKSCFKCGYSLHYDVAHIKSISSFKKTTIVSVVNSMDNLVALCKNHHWELDNGHIEL